jgi:putative oxidoreductase
MRAMEGMAPGWGIAAVRVMMAIILIVSGYQKFAGGIQQFAGFLPQLGLPAPELLGWFIPLLELVGGILVLLGLGVRWLGLVFIIEFLVTTFYIKLPRPAPLGGWDSMRIDLMLLAAAVMLVLAGAGKASLDELLLKRRAASVLP